MIIYYYVNEFKNSDEKSQHFLDEKSQHFSDEMSIGWYVYKSPNGLCRNVLIMCHVPGFGGMKGVLSRVSTLAEYLALTGLGYTICHKPEGLMPGGHWLAQMNISDLYGVVNVT